MISIGSVSETNNSMQEPKSFDISCQELRTPRQCPAFVIWERDGVSLPLGGLSRPLRASSSNGDHRGVEYGALSRHKCTSWQTQRCLLSALEEPSTCNVEMIGHTPPFFQLNACSAARPADISTELVKARTMSRSRFATDPLARIPSTAAALRWGCFYVSAKPSPGFPALFVGLEPYSRRSLPPVRWEIHLLGMAI